MAQPYARFCLIDALKESLRETPDHRRLTRSRMVDDVIALENVTREDDVRDMARSRAAVGLLWEMCQIPDFRKVSPASHAEFVASLYRFVMSDEGKIPEDWIANQVASSDRTDGDLDTLSNRLAQIRTWTFVSQHAQWLQDPAHWRDRTKAIEDKLSDALHERLTQRFVDRRTSVLMRRLRDKEEMMAEISSDGQILVENHFVGHLDGFRFTPDASSGGIDGKAARHAAAQVLASEFTARTDALAGAPDDAITLSPTGRMVWQGSEIGRLEAGETALKPRLQILADDHLTPPDRERVVKRLEAWLAAHLDGKLKPLMALNEASDLSGLSRGLAFRLTENLGVLRRESASDEIKALDQTARGQLRKYGVRFGAFNLYFPALLKPASAELLLLLWALHGGEEHGLDPEGLPERPQQGLTSVAADSAIPEPYWRAAGFHVAGTRAVRIDMLERLSDLIRVRVSWRLVEGGEDAPSGATGDGGFRVSPELMSMVGCSGDEFASILRSLGFRLERKKLEADEGAAKPADTEAPEATTETEKPKAQETPTEKTLTEATAAEEAKAESDTAPAEPEKPEFDEIWRPGRRKEPRREARSGTKPERKERGKEQGKERGKTGQRQPRRNQSQGKGKGQSQRQAQEHAERRKARRVREEAAAENSPFAALKDLRKTLAARGRPEQS